MHLTDDVSSFDTHYASTGSARSYLVILRGYGQEGSGGSRHTLTARVWFKEIISHMTEALIAWDSSLLLTTINYTC